MAEAATAGTGDGTRGSSAAVAEAAALGTAAGEAGDAAAAAAAEAACVRREDCDMGDWAAVSVDDSAAADVVQAVRAAQAVQEEALADLDGRQVLPREVWTACRRLLR